MYAHYFKSSKNHFIIISATKRPVGEMIVVSGKKEHEGLKTGSIPRAHSFSLQYANKAVKELEKKLALCIKLWE